VRNIGVFLPESRFSIPAAVYRDEMAEMGKSFPLCGMKIPLGGGCSLTCQAGSSNPYGKILLKSLDKNPFHPTIPSQARILLLQ